MDESSERVTLCYWGNFIRATCLVRSQSAPSVVALCPVQFYIGITFLVDRKVGHQTCLSRRRAPSGYRAAPL